MMIRLSDQPDATSGISEWLRFVWACNDVEPGTFGRPNSSGDWWTGGHHETYDDARIVFPINDGDGVRIVSLTERGARIMAAAAERMGIRA